MSEAWGIALVTAAAGLLSANIHLLAWLVRTLYAIRERTARIEQATEDLHQRTQRLEKEVHAQ